MAQKSQKENQLKSFQLLNQIAKVDTKFTGQVLDDANKEGSTYKHTQIINQMDKDIPKTHSKKVMSADMSTKPRIPKLNFDKMGLE